MDSPLVKLLVEYVTVYAAIPDNWKNVAPRTFVLGQLSGISKCMVLQGLNPNDTVERMLTEKLELTNQARGTLMAILSGKAQVPVGMVKGSGRLRG